MLSTKSNCKKKMKKFKYRPLLSSAADDDDDNDNDGDDEDLKRLDVDIDQDSHSELGMMPANQRHQIHRGARKLTRFFMVFFGCLSFFLLFYIAICNSLINRRVALPGWGYNTSRNTADYVLPDEDTDLIKPQHVCDSKFFLLIVVCSAINNFEARQNIRETWGNTSEFNYNMFAAMHATMNGHYLDKKNETFNHFKDYFNNTSNYSNTVRVVFLIGRSESEQHLGNESKFRLKQEADQYDDLIQENFIDTYNNLTVKSVMMLKWVNKHCSDKSQFLMKCDDDTFVNVPNLLHYLIGGTIPIYNATVQYHDIISYKVMSPANRLNLLHNFLMGYMFCFVKPVANISSKWYAPFYMYPGDTYPKYLSGASYLMSSDVIGRLYDAALNTSLFHLEDVYITGICAEQINLPRHHNALFCFDHSKNVCSFRGTITQHYVKGDSMREAYAFVMNSTNKCPPPDKYFKTNRLRKRAKNCS